MKLKIALLSLFLLNLCLFIPNKVLANDNLFSSLAGKIILKVEEKGEAFYLNPKDKNIYFLGKPEIAFDVIKKVGIGITSDNLDKIPIGLSEYNGMDTDKDGLSDDLEKAIGSNFELADSDNDGINDKEEILTTGFVMDDKLVDKSFTAKNLGLIFIQVEDKGQAWYINPKDSKRYFLSRPIDAFNIMKKFGIGISNENFANFKNYINCSSDLDCFLNLVEDEMSVKSILQESNDIYNLFLEYDLDIEYTKNANKKLFTTIINDFNINLSMAFLEMIEDETLRDELIFNWDVIIDGIETINKYLAEMNGSYMLCSTEDNSEILKIVKTFTNPEEAYEEISDAQCEIYDANGKKYEFDENNELINIGDENYEDLIDDADLESIMSMFLAFFMLDDVEIIEEDDISDEDLLGKSCSNTYECFSYDNSSYDCVDNKCVEVDCVTHSQCYNENICIQNECVDNERINQIFPISINSCETTSSENTSSGFNSVLDIGGMNGDDNIVDYEICAECLFDFDCKDGYECNSYLCEEIK